LEDSKVNEVGSVINPDPIPTGMAVQVGSVVGRERLIVGDTYNRILGVRLMSPITRILATFGHDPGQVYQPRGIAVDLNTRNIFVVDSLNNRVQKFSPNFVFMKAWGSLGTGDGQFQSPVGITIDSNGDVYVADRLNHRVQKFDNNGLFIQAWGGPGTGDGKFNLPQCIAVEPDDDIVVTDGGNHRIQKFKSDSQFIRSWGGSGTGDGEFGGPNGVAVSPNDNIYVVDRDNDRIQKFDLNGVFIKSWRGSPDFVRARNITYNTLTTNLLVSDQNGIQIFNLDGGFVGKVDFGPILSDQ
jgi:DNA-binding beta-propeller fold protein YncE